MQCPNCQHENSEGKFCVKCGTPLVAQQQQAAATTNVQPQQQYQSQPQQTYQTHQGQPGQPAQPVQQAQPAQPNPQIEAAKQVSKLYFSYFLTVLKNPFSEASKAGSGQFVNGLITIILYSLLMPLTVFFAIPEYFRPDFGDGVLPPFIGFVIINLLISVYAFAAVKLGKVDVNLKDVIASYGSLLIPFVALLVVALILGILGSSFIAIALAYAALIISILSVPVFIVSALKQNKNEGLDAVYGTLLVYLLTIITFVVLGEMLLSEVIDSLPF